MIKSLNFVTSLDVGCDDDHPPGKDIATQIVNRISRFAKVSGPLELWRDVGWQFGFSIDGIHLVAVVSAYADRKKIVLQISPMYMPSLLLRLFGAKASATDVDLRQLQQRVSLELTSIPSVSGVVCAHNMLPADSEGEV